MRSRHIRIDPMALLAEITFLSLEARGAYFWLLLKSYQGFGRYENGAPTKISAKQRSDFLLQASRKQANRALKELEEAGLIAIADGNIRVKGYDPAAWVRGVFPARERAEIIEAAGGQCQRCGGTDDLTIDHIIPIAAEGPEQTENYQVLCRPCNSRKGASTSG